MGATRAAAAAVNLRTPNLAASSSTQGGVTEPWVTITVGGSELEDSGSGGSVLGPGRSDSDIGQ